MAATLMQSDHRRQRRWTHSSERACARVGESENTSRGPRSAAASRFRGDALPNRFVFVYVSERVVPRKRVVV